MILRLQRQQRRRRIIVLSLDVVKGTSYSSNSIILSKLFVIIVLIIIGIVHNIYNHDHCHDHHEQRHHDGPIQRGFGLEGLGVVQAFSTTSLSTTVPVADRRTTTLRRRNSSSLSTFLLTFSLNYSNNNNNNKDDNNPAVVKQDTNKKKITKNKQGSYSSSNKRFGAPRTKQTIASSKYVPPSGERIVLFRENDVLQQQRNDNNKQRRFYDSINCQHYVNDLCSGCTVMQGVGSAEQIPALQSAQLFFASASILKHCIINDNTTTNTRTSARTTTNYNRNRDDDTYSNSNSKSNNYINQNKNDDNSFFQVVMPTPITGWRTQAKLVVANAAGKGGDSVWKRQGGCQFGLYKRHTHTVIPIPQCSVHHPLINQAVTYLEIATAKAGIVAYDDNDKSQSRTSTSGGQLLRYVQLQVERATGQVCLTLVFNASELKQAQPALARLIKELNIASASDPTRTNERDRQFWHSIWCHCNDSSGNNIFVRSSSSTKVSGNSRWHRMTGPEYVREPIPNGKHGWLYFTPMSFRQGNLDGFDSIANYVAKAIPTNGAKVCELYAGVGVLGLTALAYHYNNSQQRQKDIENNTSRSGQRNSSSNNNNNESPKSLEWLRCSDDNPSNPRCFYRSVDSLPIEMSGRRIQEKSDNRYAGKKRSQFINDDDDDDDGMTIAELAAMMDSGTKQATRTQPTRAVEKTSYMIASATKAIQSGQALGANVLIVDPPRKGLDEDVLIELCKPYNPKQPYVEDSTFLTIPDEKVNWCNDIRTLIYVSCGFDAFARDCEILLCSSNAGWKLQSATGYVLFPGSDHVETIAIFQR